MAGWGIQAGEPEPAKPAAAPSLGTAEPPAAGPRLLVEDSARPTVTVSWPTKAGPARSYTAEVPWTDPEGRIALGGNLECFMALGGGRVDFGAADPEGAVVRVGFYKADKLRPLFEDLAADGEITIRVTGIRFNRAVEPERATVVHHIKFEDPSSVLGCVTPAQSPEEVNTYNTSASADTMGGRLSAKNSRAGALGGEGTRVEADATGTASLHAAIPYALFKHVNDPWLRATPGSFVEPYHFHVEFQSLPAGAMAKRVGNGPVLED